MTARTPKPKNDSSEETVIGFKGSEQHHKLKNRPGDKGDADHAQEGDAAQASEKVSTSVGQADTDGAMSSALKEAVKK